MAMLAFSFLSKEKITTFLLSNFKAKLVLKQKKRRYSNERIPPFMVQKTILNTIFFIKNHSN